MAGWFSLLIFSFSLVSNGNDTETFTLPTGKGPWCIVSRISMESKAGNIGIKPLDIILSINGQDIHSEEILNKVTSSLKGEVLEIVILRGDKRIVLTDSLKNDSIGISASFFIRNKFLTPEEMKEDLDTLYFAIGTIHPNPYASISKKKFEDSKNQLYREIRDSLRVNEFWKLTARRVAELNDGHTRLKNPIGEWGYRGVIKGDSISFPLKLNLHEDRAYITANFSEEKILKGSRLLSINDIQVDSILTCMKEYISGELQHFKLNVLKKNFPQILHAVYQFEGPFDVTIESKNGEIRELRLEAINYFRDYIKEGGTKMDFKFETIPDLKTGIMSFDIFADKEKFDSLLKKTFTEIDEKGLKYLIIDLRENGGGNSQIAEMLIDYLTDKPYRFFGGTKIKVSKYTEKMIRGIEDARVDSVYFFQNSSEVPEKNPLLFEGKIYLITSNYTFSTASGFAAVIKDFNIGTLVGEETGGLPTCYGDCYRLLLPNSNLMLSISWKFFIRPNGNSEMVDHGVLPDIPVEIPTEALTEGDPVMEKVKELIKSE